MTSLLDCVIKFDFSIEIFTLALLKI